MTGAKSSASGEPHAKASWLRPHEDGVRIAVAAQPNAKQTEVVGPHGDALKIKVASPPVDGAANESLTEFLARSLGVKVRDVSLIRGQTGRQKAFIVRGVTPEQAYVALLGL